VVRKPPPRHVVVAPQTPADEPGKLEAADEKLPLPAAPNHDNVRVRDSSAATSGQAARLGGTAASQGASQTARTSYGALLSAEIARHKVYPEAARLAGATGSVGVVLASVRQVELPVTRSPDPRAMKQLTTRSTQ
jgi:outer membrane biosynthesis protein TonB